MRAPLVELGSLSPGIWWLPRENVRRWQSGQDDSRLNLDDPRLLDAPVDGTGSDAFIGGKPSTARRCRVVGYSFLNGPATL
jgi:hypothetical protein